MFIETEDHSRIMIVDPDPALRDRLDLMFNGDAGASQQNATETLSYIFRGRTGGTTAETDIRLGLESDKPYQLVFVENELPGGEGIELIRRL